MAANTHAALLRRAGAFAPPGPAAALLRPLRDRKSAAARDGPGQRAIAVLTLRRHSSPMPLTYRSSSLPRPEPLQHLNHP